MKTHLRLFSNILLHEDNHLVVVNKPSGMLVQGDQTGDPDLLTLVKAHIKERDHKPGNVYLGLVHRLDRPVSGVVVLAKTSKAASRLSAQIRQRTPKKIYLALVQGQVPPQGMWTDCILRTDRSSQIDPGGKEAQLRFRCLEQGEGWSRVEIELMTGRHHQIRVQFASRGFAVLGDRRYGSRLDFPAGIALHAHRLTINHPTKGTEMSFEAPLPKDWPG